jgi:hypothetical protein
MIALRKIKDAIRLRESSTLTWPQICARLDIPTRKLEMLRVYARGQKPDLSRRNRFGQQAVAIAHLAGLTIPEICAEYGVPAPYVVAAVRAHAAKTGTLNLPQAAE